MNEESYLERLRMSPGNVELLREYAHWLAARNDTRGEYLETELAFRDAEAQIEELRRKMYELTVLRGLDMNWLDVVHPLLLTAVSGGTFYAASAPGAKPFVQIGDACKPDTVVGILEIGTIPNEIAAQYHGYVAEIIAKDGQAVKYGEPLLRLVRLPPSTVSTRNCS